MRKYLFPVGAAALALAVLGGPARPLRAQEEEPAAAQADNEDVTVEARGPVHEAFAEPVDENPQPGPVIAKKPPDPIPEVPPDQKPEGDNVQWIPGYWAWDGDRNNFLWVSGVWRVIPPDRKWVPGFWTQVENGWQWNPGFWAPASQANVEYLPEPPESLDYGPDSPAPDEDSTYVPGCWRYQEQRYVWQPGSWLAARPGLVWVAAHYCPTPSGYVFVDGYWDYDLAGRGLLFAPVFFNRPLWTQPNWSFQPSYCVPAESLLSCLFVRPAHYHYYFGDYYGPAYRRRGFQPWFSYGRRFHEPLFSYYQWSHRDNPRWLSGLRDTYKARLGGTLPRPPRTLVQQNTLIRNSRTTVVNNTTINSLRIVRPLTQVNNVRLTKLTANQLTAQRNLARTYTKLAGSRRAAERPGQSLVGRRSTFSLAGLPAGRPLTRGQLNPARARTPAAEGRVGRTAPSAREGRTSRGSPIAPRSPYAGRPATGRRGSPFAPRSPGAQQPGTSRRASPFAPRSPGAQRPGSYGRTSPPRSGRTSPFAPRTSNPERRFYGDQTNPNRPGRATSPFANRPAPYRPSATGRAPARGPSSRTPAARPERSPTPRAVPRTAPRTPNRPANGGNRVAPRPAPHNAAPARPAARPAPHNAAPARPAPRSAAPARSAPRPAAHPQPRAANRPVPAARSRPAGAGHPVSRPAPRRH